MLRTFNLGSMNGFCAFRKGTMGFSSVTAFLYFQERNYGLSTHLVATYLLGGCQTPIYEYTQYSTEKSRNNENQDPYVLLDPIFYTVYILPMS